MFFVRGLSMLHGLKVVDRIIDFVFYYCSAHIINKLKMDNVQYKNPGWWLVAGLDLYIVFTTTRAI